MSELINKGAVSARIDAQIREGAIDDITRPDALEWLACRQSALANFAGDRTAAAAHMDNAERAYRRILELADPKDPYPQGAEVIAQTCLDLMPVLREFIVEKRICSLETMAGCYGRFLPNLHNLARRSKPLLTGSSPGSQERLDRYGELSATFNVMSALALAQLVPVRMIKDNDWVALPSGFERAVNPDTPVSQNMVPWHFSVFIRYHQEHRLAYKVYTRTWHRSPHDTVVDDDASLVWVSQDLMLPPFNSMVSPLEIIAELTEEDRRPLKPDLRRNLLLDVLEEKTMADYRQQTPAYAKARNRSVKTKRPRAKRR